LKGGEKNGKEKKGSKEKEEGCKEKKKEIS